MRRGFGTELLFLSGGLSRTVNSETALRIPSCPRRRVKDPHIPGSTISELFTSTIQSALQRTQTAECSLLEDALLGTTWPVPCSQFSWSPELAQKGVS
jgi:hypothetical protein